MGGMTVVVIVPMPMPIPYESSGETVQVPIEIELVILCVCICLTILLIAVIRDCLDWYMSPSEVVILGILFAISLGVTLFIAMDILINTGIL